MLRPDDWAQVSVLRVVLAVILAAVSGYYLTRWAHANRMPWVLAWTLPLALDVTAYKAVTVARRAVDEPARRLALLLVWGCVLVSVAGNGAMHAVDFGALAPNLATVVATGMVFPVALVAGHIVTGGMTTRPRPPVDDPDAARAALGALYTALGVATAPRRARPRRPAPAPAVTAHPTAGAPTDEDDLILQGLVDGWREKHPTAGRRALATYLAEQGRPVKDHVARALLPAPTAQPVPEPAHAG